MEKAKTLLDNSIATMRGASTILELIDGLQSVNEVMTIMGNCTILIVLPLSEIKIIADTLDDTRRCTFESGTTEYAQDPCCNSSLLYEQCCVPRDVNYD